MEKPIELQIILGLKDQLVELRDKLAQALARIQELEEEIKTLKNQSSKNSSKPPSQDFKENRPSSSNKGGASKGHQAHQRKLLPQERVDQVQRLECVSCPDCGNTLKNYDEVSVFQYIELVEGRCLVINYERCKHRCKHCRKNFLAPLPESVGPSPYGPHFQAMIGTLTSRYHLSKREVTSFSQELFAIVLSCGVISNIEARVANALEPSYREIEEDIRSNDDTAYVDETSWRHRGQNAYIWEIATKNLTFYQIAFHRNREARDQLLGREWNKPTVTDRYSVYHSLKVIHQYCLSHILRNFESFAERKGKIGVVGRALVKELQFVFKHWQQYQTGNISWKQLRQRCYYRRRNIQHLLQDGYFYHHQKFRQFCSQLLKDFDCLWTFLRVQGIEPTNNQAERDLRPMVLWRKKSYGTQGATGLRFVAIAGSVMQTLRKQGKRIIDFVGQALLGNQSSILFS